MVDTIKQNAQRFTFQTKILGPMLAFLVLLPAITVWLVDRHITEQSRIEAQERLSAADAVFRNSVEIRTRNLVSRFRNVVNEPRFKAVAKLNDPQTTTPVLRDLLDEARDGAEVMFLSNESGELVAGVRRDPSIALDEFAKATALLTEPAILSELDAGTLVLENRVFNIVAVPVFLDDRSPPIGKLTIGVRFSDLALRELKSLTRTEIVLLAGSRAIAGTMRGPDLEAVLQQTEGNRPTEFAGPNAVAAVIDGEHFHLLGGNLDGGNGPTELKYSLLSSYETRLRALSRTRSVLLGVSALGILIGVGTVWYLIRRITQPLRALRDGAEAVGRGDFSARVEKFSNDECGDLAEAFNQMTSNLESSHATVERTVSTLRSTQEQLVQREGHLRESEEGLRLIIESARDHVIFTLEEHGRVRRWNPAAERLLGYPAEEAEGLNYANFFSAEDRAAGVPQRLLAAAAEEGRHIFEGWRLRRDGTQFWADITLSRLPGNESVGFVEITRDITIRKEAEETLRSARDAAESANRAKSEFLANVTHEFRTPMNGIIGMTSLLLDQQLSGQQREFAETIRTSADGLLEIIGDVLDISKIEAGKLELRSQAVDINQTMEQLVDLFATRAAKKRIELGLMIAPDVPAMIVADDSRFRQTLSSLIDNAIKFTNEGSVIVSVENARNEGANHLRFVVEDTGIGIAPEAQPRLFQPFSQADGSLARSFGGAGLGLAITKRLIGLMGGKISVESTPGHGSKFSFTVQAPPAVEGSTIGTNFPPFEHRNLLIVGPQGIARLLERQAGWWGTQTQVTSGPDALAIRNTLFDAILIDEKSVSAGGGAFMTSLLQNCATPETHVIVIGSSLESPELANTDRTIAIGKPFKPAELHRALSRCLTPRMKKEDSAPSSVPPNREMAAKFPLRILVVEDNPVNTKVAQHLLKKLGYKADTATNGIEALNQLSKETYDLVFMDLQMPEMDGLTATRKLRESVPASRPPYIVAFTANASKEDREACFAAGMHDFISKPAYLTKIATAAEHAHAWIQSHRAAHPASRM